MTRLEELIDEFVSNARVDRQDADSTYKRLVKDELTVNTAASFFKARQEANRQLLDAAGALLRNKDLDIRKETAKSEEESGVDIYSEFDKIEKDDANN